MTTLLTSLKLHFNTNRQLYKYISFRLVIGIGFILVLFGIYFFGKYTEIYYSENHLYFDTLKIKNYINTLPFDSLSKVNMDSIYYKNRPIIDSIQHVASDEKFKFVTDKREKIVAAFFVIIGIFLTAWRSRESFKQNKINEENLKHEKAKFVQSRNQDTYTKGLEYFHDEIISKKIAGVYLLADIMNKDEDYHWHIIELLTAYVNEKRGRYNTTYYTILNKKDAEIYEEGADNLSDNYFKIDKRDIHWFPSPDGLEDNELEYVEYYKKIPLDRDIQAILTVLGKRNQKLEKDPETEKNLEELIVELLKATEDRDNNEIDKIKSCINRINKIDLSNVYLCYADLTKLHLENINFIGSILIDAKCSEAHFEGSFCSQAHFEGAFCSHAHFDGADCSEAHFEEAKCWISHFDGANCSHAHFDGAFCSEVHFDGSNCFNAHFDGAFCSEAHFERAICISTIFRGANCNGANFSHSNCKSSVFSNTILEGSHFEDSDCLGADFEGANCSEAHFERTNCSLAQFEDSNCERAVFKGANCAKTNFSRTKSLSAKNLSEAKSLRGVIGLSDKMKDEICEFNSKHKADLFPESNS